MVSFGHTAVGVVIGVTAYHYLGQGNLAEGLLITGTVGVVSHYLMDAIPHGHFYLPKNYGIEIVPIIIFDLFLSIAIFLGIIYSKAGLGPIFFYTMFGIGGAQLPDVLEGLIHLKILKNKGLVKLENNLHNGLHWNSRNSEVLLLGSRDIWQLFVILAAIFLISF